MRTILNHHLLKGKNETLNVYLLQMPSLPRSLITKNTCPEEIKSIVLEQEKKQMYIIKKRLTNIDRIFANEISELAMEFMARQAKIHSFFGSYIPGCINDQPHEIELTGRLLALFADATTGRKADNAYGEQLDWIAFNQFQSFFSRTPLGAKRFDKQLFNKDANLQRMSSCPQNPYAATYFQYRPLHGIELARGAVGINKNPADLERLRDAIVTESETCAKSVPNFKQIYSTPPTTFAYTPQWKEESAFETEPDKQPITHQVQFDIFGATQFRSFGDSSSNEAPSSGKLRY